LIEERKTVFELEDNGAYPPLIIFYQRSLQLLPFGVLRLVYVAYWLRRLIQAFQVEIG
jgi:hypothetical protein